MIEGRHGVKRAAAELLRFDGAYLRFSGEIRVSSTRRRASRSGRHRDASWELMYLGHARV